jgi:hypothetical protein
MIFLDKPEMNAVSQIYDSPYDSPWYKDLQNKYQTHHREPLYLNEVTNNGKIIVEIKSVISGNTESFDISFKNGLTNKPLQDVDFDFIVKKGPDIMLKGSDVHNGGKPLYVSSGSYSISYTYPDRGHYHFEIPIFKVGKEVLESGRSIVNFDYEVKIE